MSWVSVARQARAKSKAVQEDGEISEVELDDEETRLIWKKTYLLLAKGALWGDVECYAYDEITIKKRVVAEKVVVKPFDCDNCGEACEVTLKQRGHGMVCLVCFGNIEAAPEPVKKQKCRGCSFHVHSAPPADFTPEQRAYCCSICQTSKGRKHGGRCEQGNC